MILIESFNSYSAQYPNRSVVSRKELDVIKVLRTEGFDVQGRDLVLCAHPARVPGQPGLASPSPAGPHAGSGTLSIYVPIARMSFFQAGPAHGQGQHGPDCKLWQFE